VLNHAGHGDLNFCVFEALICGKSLVTPFVHHGFPELFTRGVDLFTYEQNDIPGLARLSEALVKTESRRNTVAASGHAKVEEKHYMHHRAETFAMNTLSLMLSGRSREMIVTRLRDAASIHSNWLKLLYLHHAETAANGKIGAAYLAAAKR
jgi:spore maturation protein CgeB